jgi:hypothetical protein
MFLEEAKRHWALFFLTVKLPIRLPRWVKADVTLLNFDVRFTPESGHSPTRSGCLLWAKSRRTDEGLNQDKSG